MSDDPVQIRRLARLGRYLPEYHERRKRADVGHPRCRDDGSTSGLGKFGRIGPLLSTLAGSPGLGSACFLVGTISTVRPIADGMINMSLYTMAASTPKRCTGCAGRPSTGQIGGRDGGGWSAAGGRGRVEPPAGSDRQPYRHHG